MLHVIFRKRATNYRALLREMTLKTGHPVGVLYPVPRSKDRPFEASPLAQKRA